MSLLIKNIRNSSWLTSTKDDRVHPGHARKMAAKMMNLGHKNILYYENTEGGHAATANLKQKSAYAGFDLRISL